MAKDFPVIGVVVDKTLKDTGQPGRPFYSKISEIKRVRLFGLLIYKHSALGNFPEPDKK